ncbi:MAG: hypothetical protein ACTS47_01015 [Candidatus Hodgkinia cicadicola]
MNLHFGGSCCQNPKCPPLVCSPSCAREIERESERARERAS